MMTIERAKEIQRLSIPGPAGKPWTPPKLESRLSAAAVILRHVSYGTYGQSAALMDMAWAQSVMAEAMLAQVK